MTEHVCACYGCDPVQFPTYTTRQSEGHASVYLGDDHHRLSVWLDDVQLKRCVEVFAGRDGRAVVASDHPHVCGTCGLGGFDRRQPKALPCCLSTIRGNLSLRREAVPA